MVRATIVRPLNGLPAWRLNGQIMDGVGAQAVATVSNGRLGASVPVELDAPKLEPYLREWARARGWTLHRVTLDRSSWPPALAVDVRKV